MSYRSCKEIRSCDCESLKFSIDHCDQWLQFNKEEFASVENVNALKLFFVVPSNVPETLKSAGSVLLWNSGTVDTQFAPTFTVTIPGQYTISYSVRWDTFRGEVAAAVAGLRQLVIVVDGVPTNHVNSVFFPTPFETGYSLSLSKTLYLAAGSVVVPRYRYFFEDTDISMVVTYEGTIKLESCKPAVVPVLTVPVNEVRSVGVSQLALGPQGFNLN